MKMIKRFSSIILCFALVVLCFSGCSSKNEEIYSDTTAILGYTQEVEPFIKNVADGKAEGFCPELWAEIFDSVKGDLKSYRFEKVEKGYTLEEDGGFFDSDEREYSACLMIGAVSKNDGTFNEDYSYTEPIITNRIITVTSKSSKIKGYTDFSGAKVEVVSQIANDVFNKHTAISKVCASINASNDIKASLEKLDKGEIDAVVTDEFSFMPEGVSDKYIILDGELDKIEYVIACAKNSGWKDSINEAIREAKSEKYGDGDTFTPLVEKHFGYNASSFNYTTDTDK